MSRINERLMVASIGLSRPIAYSTALPARLLIDYFLAAINPMMQWVIDTRKRL